MTINIGKDIYNFAKELWHLDRSITGEGLRQTLKKIKNKNPNLKIKKISSGKKVYDWTVPDEWKVNEASELEKIHCPHCGKKDTVNYVMVDQRQKYERRWE